MLEQIKALALRQLHEVGAAGLSLRQIARDMEMVSSAIYRYFPSRDELLTALIVDAYNALGEEAERAGAGLRDRSPREQWLGVCSVVRAWARAHPDQYALIYGSPVPGYRAPQGTIPPAARVALVLIDIVRAAKPTTPRLPPGVAEDMAQLRASSFPDIAEPRLATAIVAWTQLLGAIDLELFGHLNNVVVDFDAFFGYQMELMADLVGLGL